MPLIMVILRGFRAGIPVVAALGSIFIENKVPTGKEFIALLIVVLGVAIAVWEGSESRGSMVGIGLCALGEKDAWYLMNLMLWCSKYSNV
jgi:hypothetical protein